MKQIEYSLVKNDDFYFLESNSHSDNSISCPYKRDDVCGSWCPLFEVGEEEDGKVEVILNCGRGRELLAKDETGE